MSEWREYSLGDLVKSISETYKFNSEEIIFLNTSDIYEGKVLNHNKFIVSELPGQAKKRIQKDDILFSEIRPNNRRYAYIDFDSHEYVVSTKLMVLRSEPEIYPKFLFYYLTNKYTLAILQNIAENRSGTFPQITFDNVAELDILLPDLGEQKEIAKFIENLDKKIYLLRSQNETLEAIAQTLFKRWFVEFEFPDENGLPYKSSGGKMVSSELGEIPEGWRVGKINEISTISTGKGLKRAEYIEKGSYPVYGANGEMCRTNSFLFDEKLIITGRVGTLGNIYIVNGKMWISDNVLILKPEENFFYFTYFAMKRINFQSLNRGSTQPLITQTDLKIFEIIIPGEKLVDKFDLFSFGVFSKIENNMGQIDHLTKIRDILLPKLMSGQIRVN